MPIHININLPQMVRETPLGEIHGELAPYLVYKDFCDEEGTPPPDWSITPIAGLIANPIGELVSLVQIIVGIAGILLFSLPALCHTPSRDALKLSAKTLTVGIFMALMYPIRLVVGHTIGFCFCRL